MAVSHQMQVARRSAAAVRPMVQQLQMLAWVLLLARR